MNRERIEHCLERVAAYRASGQRSEEWALANGVKPRALAAWCSNVERWRAKLDGVPFEPTTRTSAPAGFVAARLAAARETSAAVRIELSCGATSVELHWPLTHARELAAWLREVGR